MKIEVDDNWCFQFSRRAYGGGVEKIVSTAVKRSSAAASVGFMGTLRLYSAHQVYYYIEYVAIVYRETRGKRVCLFKRVFIAYRFSSPGLSRMQSLIERCTDPHRYGLIIILFDNICTI